MQKRMPHTPEWRHNDSAVSKEAASFASDVVITVIYELFTIHTVKAVRKKKKKDMTGFGFIVFDDKWRYDDKGNFLKNSNLISE